MSASKQTKDKAKNEYLKYAHRDSQCRSLGRKFIQHAECLGFDTQHCIKSNITMHVSNSNDPEVEAGGSSVQGHL